jgi:uroporphyrinogen decarboxylase
MSLTHRERLKACIDNDPALDRPPVALWRHFPVDDQTPESLAQATLTYQNTYDFDFVKVTPASSYCLRDWGVEDKWDGNSEGTRTYTKRVIQKPQDWEKLPFLSPTSPHLARQLTCLRTIKRALGPNTPTIQTIFSPLAQAKNLAGQETLLVHLRQHPDAVMKGLSIITESTRRFIEAAIDTADIDGIFYAVQHAQAHLLTADEFSKFSKPYDLMLLKTVTRLPFNMVHLHGTHIFFDAVARYPVEMLNWHDRETDWSLTEARKHYSRLGTGSLSPAFCGGLSTETLVFGTPNKVRSEAQDALEQTSQRRFILGTGCVTPIIAPHGNIMAARRAIEPR